MADDVPLRDHLEARLDALSRSVDQRFVQVESSTKLARDEIDRRLEQLNELRGEVIKDRSEYLRADIFEGRIAALEGTIKANGDRISGLDNWRSKAMGAGAVLSLVSGAIGAAIARIFGLG